MRRMAVLLVALAAVACGGGPSPFSGGPVGATSAETTIADAPATSAPPTTTALTTTTTTITPGPDLTAYQVLIRLDGALPVGTFDATICNLGDAAAGPFQVVIAANGAQAVVVAPGLEPRSCRDAFDAAVTFDQFGVAAGDQVAVAVTVSLAGDADPSNDDVQKTLLVAKTTPAVEDPQKVENYEWCLRDWPHDQCTQYLGLSPVADPHEVAKMGDGWAAVVPAEYEPLAAQAVATMAICFPSLEAYLGIPFPAAYLPLPWRFLVGPSFFGSSNEGITLAADADYYRGALAGEYANWQWSQVLDGKCLEAHEPTHVLVDETPIPGWLNEGLAVYLSHPERGNWYFAGELRRCREDGYVDINEFTGEETAKDYADLEGGFGVEGRDRGDYYATGACFWEWFEGAYGHAAFQQVIQALADLRVVGGCPDSASCPNFASLVAPIVGEDISPYTEAHFGFGPDYDNWSP